MLFMNMKKFNLVVLACSLALFAAGLSITGAATSTNIVRATTNAATNLSATATNLPATVTNLPATVTNVVANVGTNVVVNVGTSPPQSQSPSLKWAFLIPILVPVIVAGIKGAIPLLPKPVIPVIAVFAGVALEIVLDLTNASNLGPVWGAVLGAAGIGLRELVDQFSQLKAKSDAAKTEEPTGTQ